MVRFIFDRKPHTDNSTFQAPAAHKYVDFHEVVGGDATCATDPAFPFHLPVGINWRKVQIEFYQIATD